MFYNLVERNKYTPYIYIYSFMDETDGISHSTNTLGRDMKPIILSPAMGK